MAIILPINVIKTKDRSDMYSKSIFIAPSIQAVSKGLPF
jgi:hypothetical protein